MELACIIVFGIIIVNAIEAKVKIEQARAKAAGKSDNTDLMAIRNEISDLRQQIQTLRDTTTQYDLSFDNALQRVERRVDHLEQRQNIPTHTPVPQQPNTRY